ncbi:hypothetical protein LguiA_020227 [Lonicera macranthoides]
MLLSNSNNGDEQPHTISGISTDTHCLSEDIDSSCSTPYVSAPSSPGRGGGAGSSGGYFFSAPASPMHFVLCKTQTSMESKTLGATEKLTSAGSFEFEFSSRFSPNGPAANGSMSSADELFFNGQIRPMKLSSHLQRPQILTPLIDQDGEDEEDEKGINRCHPDYEERVVRGRDLRSKNRSLHRKARSMSPLRVEEFQWYEEGHKHNNTPELLELEDSDKFDKDKQNDIPSIDSTPCGSASSSRSSSSGRNSKKWIFLKDLLYRSKSEGRGNSREKFWNTITLSASSKGRKTNSPSLTPSSSRDDKEKQKQQQNAKKCVTGKPVNGVSKRRFSPSPHELHYTKNRAQADEMKKKTFLPYRQGLLGCLGFSSKGYGAFNGLTKTLSPVSSSGLPARLVHR